MSNATNNIRTVIFDLGGVYFTDGAKSFITKMKKLKGISEEDVIAVIGGELGKQYRTSEISPQEFWKSAKALWNLEMDSEELSRLWIEEYVPIPATGKLVQRLRQAGYEVLFLSDNASDRIEYLNAKYHFINEFSGGIFSHMAKVRKPDKKMYEAVLAIASHPASACVYIDDKPHLLEPATELGMAVIPFTTPEDVEKKLRELGLRF